MAVIVYQPAPMSIDFGSLPLYYLAKLDAAFYAQITGRDFHAAVLEGIDAVRAAGFPSLIVPCSIDCSMLCPWHPLHCFHLLSQGLQRQMI